jgi:hypothetical protein
MRKNQYPKPMPFTPSDEEVKQAMEKVSEFFKEDKTIGSSTHPNLKVKGKRPVK